jgi:hypothetical protein
MNRKPSVIFRDWAFSRLSPDDLDRLQAVERQDAFDEILDNLRLDLTAYWRDEGGQPLQFGASRKLTDLLMKAVARWTGLPAEVRQRLVHFLHVPLDQFVLAAIRNCVGAPHSGHPLRIPRNATMRFVDNQELYDRIQAVMREVADEATVPPICIDLLAWNLAHC